MQDATSEYEPIHPAGTIDKFLPPEKHLGEVDGVSSSEPSQPPQGRDDAQQTPLSILQNLDDLELEAKKYLSKKAWIYYSSAADSLSSHRDNIGDWDRIVLRPRILR